MIFYRIQQAIILIIHLLLLAWIIYVLRNTGSMDTMSVIFHFVGMSTTGAGLIFGSAKWAKYHHEKELKKNKSTED